MEFGNGFATIGKLTNSQDHQKMLMYFDHLKSSNEGLEYSATELCNMEIQKEQEELIFLHWKVLEYHIQNRHQELQDEVIMGLRKALLSWLEKHCRSELKISPKYLRNKSAQVFALLFAKEFLTSWQSMGLDVMKICLGNSNTGVDFYLRMLLAIDAEVVDRTILHTEAEQIRNTDIKDTMRETCIPSMVESWYNLLMICTQKPDSNISSMCLQVIGAYIVWIDINMVANEKMLPLIFSFLAANVDSDVREAACECLHDIAVKGMLPIDKLRLVEILWPEIKQYCAITQNDDIDYVIKLSKLVGGIGSILVTSWNKFVKLEGVNNTLEKCSNEIQQNYYSLLSSAEEKAPFCFQFLGHDDDDVSQQCIQFALDYIDMLKKIDNLSVSQKQNVVTMFETLVKKFKYDGEYCFENEGEEEAEFKEYLKGVKIVYENLIQLEPALVQGKLCELLRNTLENWNYVNFTDVEVCIRMLYLLGESLAVNLGSQFTDDSGSKTPLHEMMVILTTSGVCDHPHAYVRLMFFETIARYDRYFVLRTTNENVLLGVTQAFLDERGIKSSNPAIRSRCAYLLSRFVKTTSKALQSFTEQLLNKIQELLVLSSSDSPSRVLSNDDQLFIYELAGTLIVNSSADMKLKNTLMTALLTPLVEGFNPLLKKMHEVAKVEQQNGDENHIESKSIASTVNYAMSYASRTSKAFSNKHTMAQAGCSNVYTETLRIFLSGFDIEVHHDIVHSGIRQYLHRMVICLEEEVLPFVPIAVQHLLKHCNARALHQFIPLINQIVNKFKNSISPFLAEIFMPVVRTVFQILSQGDATEDAKTVRRTYFQFIHAIVSNNLAEVILKQEINDAEMVLSTVKQGAVDYPDPIAQKVCFNIFHKILESWKSTQNGVLREFILQIIVPACFQAPMQPTFDLSDGQTVLVLKETSSIMKDLYELLGNDLIQVLSAYLPTVEVSDNLVQEYCQALAQLDAKQFRNYTKAFFQAGRQ